MRIIVARRHLAAVIACAATAATPLVTGAGRALATSGGPAVMAPALRVATVEAAPMAEAAPCPRKVRIVYGGPGVPQGCAAR